MPTTPPSPLPTPTAGGSRALLYCTFNGAANCTNGIGRQTQTLLGALDRRWNQLTAATGPFTPYLAIPAPGPATWAYDPTRLESTRQVIGGRGGSVIALRHDQAAPFWTPSIWQQLSHSAAQAAHRLAARYDQVAVIAVDTPYAGTGDSLHRLQPESARGAIRTLLALYGTSHLHDHPRPDPDRLAWEHEAIRSAHRHEDVYVGDIGSALTRHLRARYGLRPERLLPYASSLELTAPDLQPMPRPRALAVAAENGVPLDRPVVLAVGRTDPTKGLDTLITALAPHRDTLHLVAIVVPFDGHDPLATAYQQQITATGLRATYVPRFTRDLPRALASLPETVAVACPSRGEALANLPLETALWARDGGPVVIAPDRDGFPETIAHQRTGLLYDPDQPGALTRALGHAAALTDRARRSMNAAAYRKTAAERDIVPAYTDTLTRLFTPAPPAAR